MNHINRLLMKLKAENNPNIYSAICFIQYDNSMDKWIAKITFWDGKPLSGSMQGILSEDWITDYDTADEAAEAVKQLFSTLDIKKQAVILIDDLAD